MVGPVRAQAADVRTDVLVRVPGLGLRGSCGAITGRSAVLEVNAGI